MWQAARGVEEERLPQPNPLGAGLHERRAPTHTTFLRGSHYYKRVVALVCPVCAGTTGGGGLLNPLESELKDPSEQSRAESLP